MKMILIAAALAAFASFASFAGAAHGQMYKQEYLGPPRPYDVEGLEGLLPSPGLVPPATAQQEVRTLKTADGLLSLYRSGNAVAKTAAVYLVNGFIGGVMATSVHAEQNGKPVVCFTDAAVGQEFVIENMERLVREQPDLKTTMWQVVAFTALREAFPCK
jgi:hypothetical protein